MYKVTWPGTTRYQSGTKHLALHYAVTKIQGRIEMQMEVRGRQEVIGTSVRDLGHFGGVEVRYMQYLNHKVIYTEAWNPNYDH